MELIQVKFAHCFYIIRDWICSQSNQVTSSNHMEKEGLSRVLKFLDAKSLQVGTLVTDMHKQIDKFISRQYPDIEHCYDVWHVSKGKVVALENCM